MINVFFIFTVSSASSVGPHHEQLIVTDSNNGRRFLVDTGAQIFFIPPTLVDKRLATPQESLQAANGTSIATYGQRNTILRLGSHSYSARLVIADVK